MTAYTIATAPVIIDGMVHLTYFDRDAQLSFIWSGRTNEPIHVQHGGYGEPTVELIDPEPVYTAPENPVDLFDWFRTVCDNWTARWDGSTQTGQVIPEPDTELFGVEQVSPNVYVVRI